MRQKLLLTVLTAITLGVVAIAAQQKPNFSGRWVTVSPTEAAGQEQVVTHDAATLTTGHASEGGGHGAVYKLDGTESRNVLTSHGEPIVTRSKAAWSGAQLTITSNTTYPDGRTRESKEVWSLDAEGRLVIEVNLTVSGQQPMTIKMVSVKK